MLIVTSYIPHSLVSNWQCLAQKCWGFLFCLVLISQDSHYFVFRFFIILFCLFVVVEKEKKNCASIQYVLAGNPVVHGRSFNRECADKIF